MWAWEKRWQDRWMASQHTTHGYKYNTEITEIHRDREGERAKERERQERDRDRGRRGMA